MADDMQRPVLDKEAAEWGVAAKDKEQKDAGALLRFECPRDSIRSRSVLRHPALTLSLG